MNVIDAVRFMPVMETLDTNLPAVAQQLVDLGAVVIVHSGFHSEHSRLVAAGYCSGRETGGGFPSITDSGRVIKGSSFNFMAPQYGDGVKLILRGLDAESKYPYRADGFISGIDSSTNIVGGWVKDGDEDIAVGLGGENLALTFGLALVVFASANRAVVTDETGKVRQLFSGQSGAGEPDYAMYNGQLVPRMIFNLSGLTILAVPREIADQIWPVYSVGLSGAETLDEIKRERAEVDTDFAPLAKARKRFVRKGGKLNA